MHGVFRGRLSPCPRRFCWRSERHVPPSVRSTVSRAPVPPTEEKTTAEEASPSPRTHLPSLIPAPRIPPPQSARRRALPPAPAGTGTGQTINPSNPTETLGFSLGSQSHQQDANNRSRRSITDVRSAGQDGFDRVVFELDGGSGQISWGASYQNPPMNAASDDPIPHPGDSALVVGVTGLESPYDSSYRDLTAVTVTPVDTSSVVQVQGDGWFEGATMFIISVDGGDRPFRVFSLDGPHRLVIDIQTS